MLVNITKRGKAIIYGSEGSKTTDPFIGRLEELPEFIQTAIAILNMAGEGVLVEGVGRLTSWPIANANGMSTYHIMEHKE